MTTEHAEIGRRLRAARIRKRLTQRQAAEQVGLLNASDVSRHERGEVSPMRRLPLYAEAYGVSVSSLLGEEETVTEDARRNFLTAIDLLATTVERLELLADRLDRERAQDDEPPDSEPPSSP